MRRLVPLAVVCFLMVVWAGDVVSQTSPGQKNTNPYVFKLPIPEFDIPCDVSVWKGSFQITKVSHNKDEGKVVFLLKTLKQFKFTDDGFTAPLRFFDEDNVSL